MSPILEDTDLQSDETTHFGMDVLYFDSYTSRSQMVHINSKSSPLLDSKSSVRIQIQSLCRAWGIRVFRGRNLGYCLLPNTHEPDWRLLSPSEAERLTSMSTKTDLVAPDVPVSCVAQAPPLLTIFLRRKNVLPPQVVEEAEKSTHSLDIQQSMREASGLLLLTPHRYDPTSFKVSIVSVFKQNL
ncbi:unnamed protein product [Schistosoma mattheei]|uniref:Uncharacterized protein n=1 Tax=Schistosoma mattheei TaxID=31246 RepID=A0A3P7ZXW3_9TREM|nr:unnamed protein product [Schistosoma mattheei]